MKILFLYTELAGYFVNCIHQLSVQYDCQVTLVHYPISPDAPFEFETQGIDMVPHDSLSREELFSLCVELNPTIVYVAGWVNKRYVALAKHLRQRGSIVIGGMDNTWRGTWRQRLACLGSPFFIKPTFHFLWVAGNRQYEYARRLGFSSKQILSGLYAADVVRFFVIANAQTEKTLVFVGRLEKIKGVHLLVEAFKTLRKEEQNGWKLILIGNGALKNQFAGSHDIEVYDFMQPAALVPFVAHAGGFILPSLYEPWGVVVQEFAAAGKPLLLSDEVNSGEKFLIPNYNGYQFRSDDVADLRNTLIDFFALSDDERKLMGRRSNELAMQGSPRIWAANFVSVLHHNHLGITAEIRI